MEPMDVDAIVRAQAARPRAISYGKDCYALSLLAHVIGGGRPICALRRGAFARLLEKSVVKRALARAARGLLEPVHLGQALPETREEFPITFGRWGATTSRGRRSDYYQTSRPGQNVVLQLNFPTSHDRAYTRLVRPGAWHPFMTLSHPVRADAPFTLAWARLDLDLDAGELLIEEVQSDWVREAKDYRALAQRALAEGEPSALPFTREFDGTPPELLTYVDRTLAPYARVWQECVLTAAIEVSYREFGIRRVFFHTHESGRVMKRLYGRWQPPLSLYSELPERFCFERTKTPPRILRHDSRVRRNALDWFRLELV